MLKQHETDYYPSLVLFLRFRLGWSLVRICITCRHCTFAQFSQFLIAFASTIQQSFHMCGCFWDGIDAVGQCWGKPNAQLLANDLSQLAASSVKSLRCCLKIWFFFNGSSTNGVEHFRVVEVTGHGYISNCDELKSAVLDIAFNGAGHD